MWTTDTLCEEHRWILLLIRALERTVEEAMQRGRLDGACAAESVALCKHFADGLHQDREERCLFPLLLSRAPSVAEQMQVVRLSGEHELERRALERLDRTLLAAIWGEQQSVRDFCEAASHAIALQRAHIARENSEMLPLVERLLTSDDDRALALAFARLEQNAAQDLRAIRSRIEALCARLGLQVFS